MTVAYLYEHVNMYVCMYVHVFRSLYIIKRSYNTISTDRFFVLLIFIFISLIIDMHLKEEKKPKLLF